MTLQARCQRRNAKKRRYVAVTFPRDEPNASQRLDLLFLQRLSGNRLVTRSDDGYVKRLH